VASAADVVLHLLELRAHLPTPQGGSRDLADREQRGSIASRDVRPPGHLFIESSTRRAQRERLAACRSTRSAS
jgi:hypothetical protein